jgi:hypothetical protein
MGERKEMKGRKEVCNEDLGRQGFGDRIFGWR